MFFLHPKAEKEQESKALMTKFLKYLGIGLLAVAAMRAVPIIIKRDR
jgi:hypothetical protein